MASDIWVSIHPPRVASLNDKSKWRRMAFVSWHGRWLGEEEEDGNDEAALSVWMARRGYGLCSCRQRANLISSKRRRRQHWNCMHFLARSSRPANKCSEPARHSNDGAGNAHERRWLACRRRGGGVAGGDCRACTSACSNFRKLACLSVVIFAISARVVESARFLGWARNALWRISAIAQTKSVCLRAGWKAQLDCAGGAACADDARRRRRASVGAATTTSENTTTTTTTTSQRELLLLLFAVVYRTTKMGELLRETRCLRRFSSPLRFPRRRIPTVLFNLILLLGVVGNPPVVVVVAVGWGACNDAFATPEDTTTVSRNQLLFETNGNITRPSLETIRQKY